MSAQNSKPTHRAYSVKGEGKSAHWTEIGAMWCHQDGKGYNIKLNALPVDGQVTIRLIEPKTAEGQDGAQ